MFIALLLAKCLALPVETEWEHFLSRFRVLDSWLGRGAFQLFEAVLTLELSRSTAPGKLFHGVSVTCQT